MHGADKTDLDPDRAQRHHGGDACAQVHGLVSAGSVRVVKLL